MNRSTSGGGIESGPPPAPPGLYRRSTRAAEFAARYATADVRSLPDFIIVGAQRSGTTSLYRWLTARPDVAPAWKKEVHYFDLNYDKSLRWYRAHFPLRRPGRMSGESTPYLLFHPLAPERAAKDLPTTRFVAMLRDPVERAISNHWLRRRNGAAQNESLEEILDREPVIMAEESELVLRGSVSLRHMAYSYMSRGEYAPQLRRWFETRLGVIGCWLSKASASAPIALPLWRCSNGWAYPTSAIRFQQAIRLSAGKMPVPGWWLDSAPISNPTTVSFSSCSDTSSGRTA